MVGWVGRRKRPRKGRRTREDSTCLLVFPFRAAQSRPAANPGREDAAGLELRAVAAAAAGLRATGRQPASVRGAGGWQARPRGGRCGAGAGVPQPPAVPRGPDAVLPARVALATHLSEPGSRAQDRQLSKVASVFWKTARCSTDLFPHS